MEPLGLSAAYCKGCLYARLLSQVKLPGYVSCTHKHAKWGHVIWERSKGGCGPNGNWYVKETP